MPDLTCCWDRKIEELFIVADHIVYPLHQDWLHYVLCNSMYSLDFIQVVCNSMCVLNVFCCFQCITSFANQCVFV